jgi:hypothetical protein
MSNLDMLSAIVGALLPALVATINRSRWPAWAKGLVMLGSSVAVGAATAALTGDLTGKTWAQSALIVGGAATAAYRLWWHPTGIGSMIERATEPKEIKK